MNSVLHAIDLQLPHGSTRARLRWSYRNVWQIGVSMWRRHGRSTLQLMHFVFRFWVALETSIPAPTWCSSIYVLQYFSEPLKKEWIPSKKNGYQVWLLNPAGRTQWSSHREDQSESRRAAKYSMATMVVGSSWYSGTIGWASRWASLFQPSVLITTATANFDNNFPLCVHAVQKELQIDISIREVFSTNLLRYVLKFFPRTQDVAPAVLGRRCSPGCCFFCKSPGEGAKFQVHY